MSLEFHLTCLIFWEEQRVLGDEWLSTNLLVLQLTEKIYSRPMISYVRFEQSRSGWLRVVSFWKVLYKSDSSHRGKCGLHMRVPGHPGHLDDIRGKNSSLFCLSSLRTDRFTTFEAASVRMIILFVSFFSLGLEILTHCPISRLFIATNEKKKCVWTNKGTKKRKKRYGIYKSICTNKLEQMIGTVRIIIVIDKTRKEAFFIFFWNHNTIYRTRHKALFLKLFVKAFDENETIPLNMWDMDGVWLAQEWQTDNR